MSNEVMVPVSARFENAPLMERGELQHEGGSDVYRVCIKDGDKTIDYAREFYCFDRGERKQLLLYTEARLAKLSDEDLIEELGNWLLHYENSRSLPKRLETIGASIMRMVDQES